MSYTIKKSIKLKYRKMKKEFRPIYKKEEMENFSREFLIDTICSLERDRYNLQEELSERIKWFSEILKKK